MQNSPARSDPADGDRHFVTALARGLELLSVFRAEDSILGNQELARRTALPKSTVSRLTYTLTKLGYLEPAHDALGAGGYRLGARVLALGSTMLQRIDIRAHARPLMQQLADETGTLVALGTPSRRSMIYVESCRGAAVKATPLSVGSRLPMATTAVGRAYLATCSDAEREVLMRAFARAQPRTWPVVEQGILRALETHRMHGCCTSFAEWRPTVNAIATGFRLAGLPPLALSCGAPATHASAARMMDEVRPRMLRTIERLTLEERAA